MKLSGYTIFTNNVAGLTKHYTNVLGVEPSEVSEKSTLYLIGGIRFFIHELHKLESGVSPAESHLEFTTQDLDREVERMRSVGVVIEVEPKNYY